MALLVRYARAEHNTQAGPRRITYAGAHALLLSSSPLSVRGTRGGVLRRRVRPADRRPRQAAVVRHQGVRGLVDHRGLLEPGGPRGGEHLHAAHLPDGHLRPAGVPAGAVSSSWRCPFRDRLDFGSTGSFSVSALSIRSDCGAFRRKCDE